MNYKIILCKMNNGATTVMFIDSYGGSGELNECGGLTPMLVVRGNNVCH